MYGIQSFQYNCNISRRVFLKKSTHHDLSKMLSLSKYTCWSIRWQIFIRTILFFVLWQLYEILTKTPLRRLENVLPVTVLLIFLLKYVLNRFHLRLFEHTFTVKMKSYWVLLSQLSYLNSKCYQTGRDIGQFWCIRYCPIFV